MSSIIRSEIDSIQAGIYGEDIRGDICTAFEKLSNTESTGAFPFKTAIENAINSAIDLAISGLDIGKDALKFKGILYNNSNLNAYATTKNGDYSGIYFIYCNYSYTNLPSEFTSLDNANGILVNINGSDEAIDVDGYLGTPFLQIVFPIGTDFGGKFWARTSITQGWKVAGGVVVDPNDIATAVTNYFNTHPPLSPTDQAAIEAALDSYMQTHDVSADVDAENVYPIITNYIGNPPSDALKNKIVSWSKAGMGGANTGGIYDAVAQFNSVYAAWNEDPNNADNQAPEPYIWHVDSDGSGPDKAYYDQTVYDALFEYRAGGSFPKNVMNDLTRYVVSDGIIGFAAFKRTSLWKIPQMYGAKADGVTNDRDAIQRAIDDNRGGTLYFPAGTYIIGDQLQIGWADHTDPKYTDKIYTDMIFDPSAIIKAGNDIPEGSPGHVGWAGNSSSSKGMILIGESSWHEISHSGYGYIKKGRKKIFKGGVFDSHHKYVSWIIQVSQDVTDFDMSDSVLLATNATSGLSIGSPNWRCTRHKENNTWGAWSYYNAGGDNASAKNDVAIAQGYPYGGSAQNDQVKFDAASMDAYIHHVTIMKYYYNDDELPDMYKNAYPDKEDKVNHNRASGLIIYSSDNNFDNLRIYYFKRQVKITRGSGNFFSDVHTLGLKYGSTASDGTRTPLYDTFSYGTDTSGFHIEHPTEITLDQCYVDTDTYFLSEQNETKSSLSGSTDVVVSTGADSKINVSQCTHYEYAGANRTLKSFHIATGIPSKLFIDGFYLCANGDRNTEKHWNRHAGIELSCTEPTSTTGGTTYNTGAFFEAQVNSFNMSLERIRITAPDRIVRGDLLKGALSGQKGTLLFKPTELKRKQFTSGSTTTNSKHSYWYKLCDIPVGAGNSGTIDYEVTFWLTGRYVTFPMSIKTSNLRTSEGPKNLIINRGSGDVKTDDTGNKDYELAFTYNNPDTVNALHKSYGMYRSYTVWIRLINGATSQSGTYTGRTLKRVVFDSATAITPANAICHGDTDGYETLPEKSKSASYADDIDLRLTSLGQLPTSTDGSALVTLTDSGDNSTGTVLRINANSSSKKTMITSPAAE